MRSHKITVLGNAAKKLSRAILIIFLCLLMPATSAGAQENPKDYEAECIGIGLGVGCPYYDPNSCSASDGTSVAGTGLGDLTGGSSVRATGATPPYIVEMFAIETLKSIAQKRGVAETNTVTEEHVIAVVAFILGEGGDIANKWRFNPLNTGLNAPELIEGEGKADGTQSFKSFDAGVEATARTMVGQNQRRLSDTLIQQNSNAQQFMEALTFYKRYPDNKFWAAASLPNPERYYQERLSLVQQVRNNYADIAGTQMGVRDEHGNEVKEYIERITAKEKLKFKPATDTSSSENQNASNVTGGDSGCNSNSSGIVSGDIVKTALHFAWANTDKSHQVHKSDSDGGKSESKPTYQEGQPQYNGSKGLNEFTDCGVFVATVMVASNADPNYPRRGSDAQMAYVQRNQAKYEIKVNPQSTADLQPGDILIKSGHTYIYTGPYKGDDGKDYNSAAASLARSSFGHTPEAETWYKEAGYIRARLINPGGATAGGGDVRL